MNRKSYFKSVVCRELKIILSRRIYLFALLIIPIFTIIFLSTIFGNGQIEKVPIGVVDYTCSQLSEQIVEKLDASPKLNIAGHHYLNEKEAHKAMQSGKIYGYIIIPVNFDQQFYSGKSPVLSYCYQKSVLATGEDVNGAFITVLGDIVATATANAGKSAGLTGSQANAVVMPIEANSIPLYNTGLDFTIYITYPFIFVFLQILLIVLIVYVIGTDKKSPDWPDFSKGSAAIAILGKVFPYFIIFSIYALATNCICFWILHIPINQSLLQISLAGIVLIASSIAVGVFIAIFIRNFSIAISIASMYGALGATMCGVTFPIEQMGSLTHALSFLFPIRHFTHVYHNIVYLNLPIQSSLADIAIMTAFIVPLFFIGRRTLEKAFKSNSVFSRLPAIYGVILIAVGGTVGYSVLYNILYLPNTVKEVPIAVVDASQNQLSRKFIRYLDATEGVHVYASTPNMKEASVLMDKRNIRGILYLPPDFSNRINRGEKSPFTLLGTTSSLLYYLTLQSNTTEVMLQLDAESRAEILKHISLEGKLALSQAPQIKITGTALYNKDGGYATFLMPIVLIVALFQTMIMAIGVYKGGNTVGSYKKTIQGFTTLYMVISLFVIGAVPIIFNLPNIGNPLLIFPFIFLFLLTTSLFGTLLSYYLPDSESVNLIVPFFSVGLIFISGMSFPREAIPLFWQAAYYIFPCSPAITGYIKLNTMGAPLAAVIPEIAILIIQGLIYGGILYKTYRLDLKSSSISV